MNEDNFEKDICYICNKEFSILKMRTNNFIDDAITVWLCFGCIIDLENGVEKLVKDLKAVIELKHYKYRIKALQKRIKGKTK